MKSLLKLLFTTSSLFLILTQANSQSMQEFNKLQQEYKKALDRQALQKPLSISDAEKTANSTALPDRLIYTRKEIESLLVNTDKLLKQLQFYEDSITNMPYVGYDFFSKRDTIPFWQNIPISKNYILGPGDEVIIAMWGESSSNNNEIINRDGQIFIEKIGVLNLGGKSIEEAKNYIISKYSKVYSTLIGSRPKSFIDLTLGELKSINVHFVGFVNLPGVHLVHPFSNVISGLMQAGGVDYKGSLRKINIIRNGKAIETVDLYSYLIQGNKPNDMRLLDQDIVFVPPRISTIPITGRVLNPGYYEILFDEEALDLIKFSGGRDRGSSNTTFIYRNGSEIPDGFVLNEVNIANFKLFQGDSVHVPIRPETENYVYISGQVKNKGKYPYSSKLKIKDLLDATMSFDDFDFSNSMDLEKIKIFRRNSKSIDPVKIITSISDNIDLQNGDYIVVPKSNISQKIETVVLTGEINNPGRYPVNNATTLESILKLGGGFTKYALDDGIKIFRDSLQIGWENSSFILQNGDSLIVLKKSGLVFIDGEVNSPGYVSYKKNQSAMHYIKQSGGFSSFAEKKNIYIIYPNGVSKPFSGLFKPKVKEGSTIYVNQRTISGSEQTSAIDYFNSAISQAGTIATTLLSLSILMSQSQNGT